MSANNHMFIVPITTLSRKAFSNFLSCNYDFVSHEFVLQNAVQLWIDYQQDPDGSWHTNVEDEIHREYGKYLSDIAGRSVFRGGRGSNLKDQICYKNELVDSLASEIARHISEVSSYIMDIAEDNEILDFVLDSEYELLVKEAWLIGKSVKFVIEEV